MQEKLTRQGVRDLNHLQNKAPRAWPHGAFCSHGRMRYGACSSCRERGVRCRVECRDCGLTWMFGEGVYG